MKEFETDGQLSDIIAEIERKQRKLINDIRSDALTGSMGTIPVNENGDYDPNRLTVVEIDRFWKIIDFIRDNEATFTSEDIPKLIEAEPYYNACIQSYTLDNGFTMSALRFTIFIAEKIYMIPVNRYIERHHKKLGTDKKNAQESIALAKDLINAFMNIGNKNLKALIVKNLIEDISYLQDERDGKELEEDTELSEEELQAIRENKRRQAIAKAQELGIDPALIDEAYGLEGEAFKEIKAFMNKIKED